MEFRPERSANQVSVQLGNVALSDLRISNMIKGFTHFFCFSVFSFVFDCFSYYKISF